jgi:putative MFS transporter
MSRKILKIDDAFDEIGIGVYQIHAFLLFGLSLACSGMEILLFYFIQGCIADKWGLSATYESLLTAAIILGQLLGYLGLGSLADTYGRLPIVVIGWSVSGIFGVASAFSPNFWVLVTTRLFVGVGVGAYTFVTFDFFAELLPTKARAFLVYLIVTSALGMFYVIVISWIVISPTTWRYVILATSLPIFIVLIGSAFVLKESPRWLVSKHRFDEAEVNINAIKNYNENGETTEEIELVRDLTHGSDGEDFLNFGALLATEPHNLRSRTIPIWIIWYDILNG